jgi:hypothetical protein
MSYRDPDLAVTTRDRFAACFQHQRNRAKLYRSQSEETPAELAMSTMCLRLGRKGIAEESFRAASRAVLSESIGVLRRHGDLTGAKNTRALKLQFFPGVCPLP